MKFFRRIGTQIVSISVIALLITILVTMTAALLLFRNYSTNILVNSANIGNAVVKNTLTEKMDLLKSTYTAFTTHRGFTGTNPDNAQRVWKATNSDPTVFYALSDGNGVIISRSDNYTLKEFSLSASRGTRFGIIED